MLEDIPAGITDLYTRILDSMSIARYGKKLTKAIMYWAVCSARPVSMDELCHALEFDIKDKIDKIEKIERAIVWSCGGLVYIGQQSRVYIIHQTARDFLLRSGSSSDFSVDGEEGQKRLC